MSSLQVTVAVDIRYPSGQVQQLVMTLGDTIKFMDDAGHVVARMDLYETEGYQLVRREGQEEKFVEVDSNL